jgi:hypothetical protein
MYLFVFLKDGKIMKLINSTVGPRMELTERELGLFESI